MHYDISSNTYRVPVRANPTCFQAGEVQFDALELNGVISNVVHAVLRERKLETAEADAAVIDAAIHAQVPMLTSLVARRLTSAAGGRTALREVIAAAVADELQKRMPQIAQAVLDCDAQRPLMGDLQKFGKMAAPAIAQQLAEQRIVAAEAVQGLHPIGESGKAAALAEQEWGARILKNAATVREAQRAEAQARAAANPTPASCQPHQGSPAQVHAAMRRDVMTILTSLTARGTPVANGDLIAAALRLEATLYEQATLPRVTGVEQATPPHAAADVRIAINELVKVAGVWSSGVNSAVQALQRAEASLLPPKV